MSDAQEKMKRLERLSDDELLEKAWAELSALCGSKGRPKEWRMTVPVDADNDSDVLFGEVLKRYAKLKRDYYELIWEVANKHEGETRHETARRYIHERENQDSRVAMSNDALKEGE